MPIDITKLDTVDMESPRLPMKVTIETSDFTCKCALCGIPDFGTVIIEYEPREKMVEKLSVSKYLETYRDVDIFHEEVANRVAMDFAEVAAPSRCAVTVIFSTRYGVGMKATATYERHLMVPPVP